MKRALPYVIAAAAGVLLALWVFKPSTPPSPVIVRDTTGDRWKSEADRLARTVQEKDGLIGRLSDQLRGRDQVLPQVITRIDTVVVPKTDTLFIGVEMAPGKSLTLYGLAPQDSGAYQPFVAEEIDLSGCDDRVVIWSSTQVLCDRPALGHLWVFGGGLVRSGVLPESFGAYQPVGRAGVEWSRCYQCRLVLEAAVTTDRRVEIGGRYRIPLW